MRRSARIARVLIRESHDPVWFGVLIVMVVQIGLGAIYRGCWPFVFVLVVMLAVLIAVPQLSPWLPSLTK